MQDRPGPDEIGGMYIVETELSRNGITIVYDGVRNWSFSVLGTYFGNRIIRIRFQTSGPAKGWRVYVTYENGKAGEFM